MKLYIDIREPNKIKNELQARIKNTEEKQLEIGDYEIINDENKKVLIFERKSLSDLIASIKDGRYNEQSLRLLNLEIDKSKIYYIIEGDIKKFIKKNSETNSKMLFSSMLSLSYDKFSLLRTIDEEETIEFIVRFYEKIEKIEKQDIKKCEKEKKENEIIIEKEKKENEIIREKDNDEYINVIKIQKKSNITDKNINEIMICQIPGISVKIAKQILNKYETIYNLINNLKENSNCINLYNKELKINNEKIINKKVIENLNYYLLNKEN
mgnify:CR=1 FL=1